MATRSPVASTQRGRAPRQAGMSAITAAWPGPDRWPRPGRWRWRPPGPGAGSVGQDDVDHLASRPELYRRGRSAVRRCPARKPAGARSARRTEEVAPRTALPSARGLRRSAPEAAGRQARWCRRRRRCGLGIARPFWWRSGRRSPGLRGCRISNMTSSIIWRRARRSLCGPGRGHLDRRPDVPDRQQLGNPASGGCTTGADPEPDGPRIGAQCGRARRAGPVWPLVRPPSREPVPSG